jgi:hypothetical protein
MAVHAQGRDAVLTSPLPFPRVALAVALLLACGKPVGSPPDPGEIHYSDTAAVRVVPAGPAQWLVVFERLQPEFLVTTPIGALQYRIGTELGPNVQRSPQFNSIDA